MGLAFESQRNHIKKAVSSEGTAFFMEIFKKDLSISGAMEKMAHPINQGENSLIL